MTLTSSGRAALAAFAISLLRGTLGQHWVETRTLSALLHRRAQCIKYAPRCKNCVALSQCASEGASGDSYRDTLAHRTQRLSTKLFELRFVARDGVRQLSFSVHRLC